MKQSFGNFIKRIILFSSNDKNHESKIDHTETKIDFKSKVSSAIRKLKQVETAIDQNQALTHHTEAVNDNNVTIQDHERKSIKVSEKIDLKQFTSASYPMKIITCADEPIQKNKKVSKILKKSSLKIECLSGHNIKCKCHSCSSSRLCLRKAAKSERKQKSQLRRRNKMYNADHYIWSDSNSSVLDSFQLSKRKSATVNNNTPHCTKIKVSSLAHTAKYKDLSESEKMLVLKRTEDLIPYKNSKSRCTIIKDKTSYNIRLTNNLPECKDKCCNRNPEKSRLLPSELYPKNSFFVMNLQVRYDNKKGYKLKPYECESGVCIPGQCDPYECQKRIMKRLTRKSSTMTNTGRSKSMLIGTDRYKPTTTSSETNRLPRTTKNQKQRRAPNRLRLQHQAHPRTHKSDRQAVRIGSNFSFNIEFSKDKLGHSESSKPPRKKQPEISSSGTSYDEKQYKGMGTGADKAKYRDGQSQSITAMSNRGLMVRTKHKRCFCTLKLNKDTMEHKGINIKMKEKLPPENAVSLLSVGQNTKQYKTSDRKQNLLPYECEPGICVPGKCDPYKCLERIKKRNRRNKDVETKSMTSNAFTNAKLLGKTRKGKAIQNEVKPQTLPPQPVPVTERTAHSSRQAVRIGSNFSFSVEFYKDKPHSNLSVKPHHTVKMKNTQQDTMGVQSTERAIQGSKNRRNQNWQTQIATKNEATRTTFLERCFCTAKLYKARIKHKQRSSYHMEKMSNKFFEAKNPQNRIPMKTTGSYAQTDKKEMKLRNQNKKQKLKPYECEPGICVPGECDSSECDKMIKKRLSRDYGTSTSTTNIRSKQTGAANAGKTKNQDVQFKRTRYRQRGNKLKTSDSKSPRKIIPTSQIIENKSKLSVNNNKQAVRISSNFSFNIEFYKDRTPGVAPTSVISKAHDKKTKNIANHRPQNSQSTSSQVSLANRHSQHYGKKFESRGSGDENKSKRCFCTLKLQNAGTQERNRKTKLNPENVSVNTSAATKARFEPAVYKNTGTKSKKKRRRKPHLKPYECEPGTCVPGLCDPVKCYERIKKRNLKSSGVETDSAVMQSTSSITDNKKHKQQMHTALEKTDKRKQQKFVEEPRFPKIHPSYWQGVKIGSNVSLNIEFYKEIVEPKSELSNDINKQRLKTTKRGRDQKVYTGDGKQKKYRKHTNMHNKSKDNENQANLHMESKGSTIGKGLKRCFCTSKLRHPEKNVGKKVVVGLAQMAQHSPFQPYPCKPEYCTCAGKVIAKKQINQNIKTGVTELDLDKPENHKNLLAHLWKTDNKIKGAGDLPANPPKVTIVSIKGHDLERSVSSKYDKDSDKKLTIVKIAGNNVDFNNISTESKQGHSPDGETNKCVHTCKYCKDIKEKQKYEVSSKVDPLVDPHMNMNALGDLKCADTCSYCKYLIDKVVPKKHPKFLKMNTAKNTQKELELILPYTPQKFKNTSSKTITKIKRSRHSLFHNLPCIYHKKKVIIHDLTSTRNKQKAVQTTFKNKVHNINSESAFNQILNYPNKKVKFNENNNNPVSEMIKCPFSSGDVVLSEARQRVRHAENKHEVSHNGIFSKCKTLIFNAIKTFRNPQAIESDSPNFAHNIFRRKPKNYAVVQIRGNRLKKDVCIPKNPKQDVLVTVSGSYIGCEITKKLGKSGGEDGDTMGSCKKTCMPCKIIEKKIDDNKKHKKGSENSQKESCQCKKCVCLKRQAGIQVIKPGQRSKANPLVKSRNKKNKTTNKNVNKKKKSSSKKKVKECTCGTWFCPKVINKKSKKLVKKEVGKTCKICGNPKCKKEFEKEKTLAEIKLQKKKLKLAKKIRKKKIKEEMKRRKIYEREDKIRYAKRGRVHRTMLRRAKKQPLGNLMRLAESVIDIGSLGLTMTGDAARAVGREVRNPITAKKNLMKARSIEKMCNYCKSVVANRGIGSTFKRVWVRTIYMPVVRTVKTMLESNRFTNALIHPCDPKKRKWKKKKRRPKPPVEFACSPYMHSLRKKPCLEVYRRFPWFYPHCISLLTLWTQVSDVILFILAVVVWCPCLAIIEFLRFFICCGLCTA